MALRQVQLDRKEQERKQIFPMIRLDGKILGERCMTVTGTLKNSARNSRAKKGYTEIPKRDPRGKVHLIPKQIFMVPEPLDKASMVPIPALNSKIKAKIGSINGW